MTAKAQLDLVTPHPLTASGMTFAHVLQARAAEDPSRPAFVFLDARGEAVDTRSFGELHARASSLAGTLVGQGLAGENILLALPSGLDFVVALFACFYAGAVAVPVPDTAGKRTADRLAAVARDAKPAAVLTLRRRENAAEFDAVRAQAPNIGWICMDALPASAPCETAPPDQASLAILQYTSGSTGSPKGVMLSHGNLMANSAMIADAFGHRQGDRVVGWLPLFHDMGLIGHVLQPVYIGGLSVLMSPLTFLQRPWRWLEAISQWRASSSGGPSQAYELCLRALQRTPPPALDLSCWRIAYCGAEPIREPVLSDFAEGFAPFGFRAEALQPCYGLAEATLLATSNPPSRGMSSIEPSETGTRPIVNCGPPWREGAVAVVDPASGRALAEGAIGEVCVSGPHGAQGYWCQEQATRETFGVDPADPSRRTVRTGDLGFIREGDLFIVGRLKDIVIVLGQNYAAEDVEFTVSRSDDLFAGLPCAVFAQDGRDREHAVVVQEIHPRDGQSDAAARAMEHAFAAVLHEHGLRLADVMLVKLGALPRTSSGKVQRARSRELYAQGGFSRLTAGGPSFAPELRTMAAPAAG